MRRVDEGTRVSPLSSREPKPRKESSPFFRELPRFVLTVICSAILSVVLQRQYTSLRARLVKRFSPPAPTEPSSTSPEAELPLFAPLGGENSSQSTGQPTYAEENNRDEGVVARGEVSANGELTNSYSKYIEEVFQVLRADSAIRLVKLDAPSAILGFQRNLAMLERGGASLRLQPRVAIIPVIAVSRNAKSFLEDMRVTYVDPKALPKRLLNAHTVAVQPELLEQYLLVPDLSGAQAKKFFFGSITDGKGFRKK